MKGRSRNAEGPHQNAMRAFSDGGIAPYWRHLIHAGDNQEPIHHLPPFWGVAPGAYSPRRRTLSLATQNLGSAYRYECAKAAGRQLGANVRLSGVFVERSAQTSRPKKDIGADLWTILADETSRHWNPMEIAPGCSGTQNNNREISWRRTRWNPPYSGHLAPGNSMFSGVFYDFSLFSSGFIAAAARITPLNVTEMTLRQLPWAASHSLINAS